jgi:hypothetical protein
VDITASTLPGQPVTGPNPCSDPDGDPFTDFSADPQHGTVTPNADGSVTYTPAAGFVGRDTFTFTVTAGSETSAPADADILVDTPPACSDNRKTVLSGSSLVISIDDDILCDDDDAPPSLDIFTGAPRHGTLTDGPGNSVTYTPARGFTGTDSFTYFARDELGVNSAKATMTITVAAPPGGGGAGTGGGGAPAAPTPPSVPPPAKAFLRSPARLGYTTLRSHGTQLFLALSVRHLKGPETIRFSCRARGCKTRHATLHARPGHKRLSLLRLVRGARLRFGGRVVVTVTRPGYLTRRMTIRVTGGYRLPLRYRCSNPDTGVRVRC